MHWIDARVKHCEWGSVRGDPPLEFAFGEKTKSERGWFYLGIGSKKGGSGGEADVSTCGEIVSVKHCSESSDTTKKIRPSDACETSYKPSEADK